MPTYAERVALRQAEWQTIFWRGYWATPNPPICRHRVIYVAEDQLGFIKVGVSVQVRERLKHLRLALKGPVRLIGFKSGTAVEEQELHDYLRPWRADRSALEGRRDAPNEWYWNTPGFRYALAERFYIGTHELGFGRDD